MFGFFCLICLETKWFVVVLHPQEKLKCDCIGLYIPTLFFFWLFTTFFLWDPPDSVSSRRSDLSCHLYLCEKNQDHHRSQIWIYIYIHKDVCLFFNICIYVPRTKWSVTEKEACYIQQRLSQDVHPRIDVKNVTDLVFYNIYPPIFLVKPKKT